MTLETTESILISYVHNVFMEVFTWRPVAIGLGKVWSSIGFYAVSVNGSLRLLHTDCGKGNRRNGFYWTLWVDIAFASGSG